MNDVFSAEERVLLRGESIPEPASLRGWYPVVARQDSLWWRYFGSKKFSEPFFHDTLAHLAQAPRFRTRTVFGALDEFDGELAPTAFVFHVSRCGSTLLTQLLSSLPGCIAMSEPPIIDSWLRLHAGKKDAESGLRKIVSALGQKRFGEERHFFVKLDSWHIGQLPLFRKAFPATPFLFLYRRPHEILASHRRQRGRQMVPGLVDAALLPVAPPKVASDLDGYCVDVLEHFFGTACRHADELILLNYDQFPHVVWTHLLDRFAISVSLQEIGAMQARAGLHSKRPERYAGDPQADSCEKLGAALQPRYEMLERLRCAQAHFG